jgi:hypothetical protein
MEVVGGGGGGDQEEEEAGSYLACQAVGESITKAVTRLLIASSSLLTTFHCNICSKIQPCVKNLIIKDFTPYFATTIS